MSGGDEKSESESYPVDEKSKSVGYPIDEKLESVNYPIESGSELTTDEFDLSRNSSGVRRDCAWMVDHDTDTSEIMETEQEMGDAILASPLTGSFEKACPKSRLLVNDICIGDNVHPAMDDTFSTHTENVHEEERLKSNIFATSWLATNKHRRSNRKKRSKTEAKTHVKSGRNNDLGTENMQANAIDMDSFACSVAFIVVSTIIPLIIWASYQLVV
jgi:hypothetical protein